MPENRENAELRAVIKKLHTALKSVAEDAAAMRCIKSVARWIIAARLIVNVVVLVNVLQLGRGA